VNPALHLVRFTATPQPAPSPVAGFVASAGQDGAANVYSPDSSSWTSYGGRIIGPPAVAPAPAPYGFYLVATGTNGLLYARTQSTGWTLASSSACANPDLTSAGSQLVVACTGTNKALYAARFDTTVSGNPYFTTFANLGGVINAGPAVYRDPATAAPVYTAAGASRDSTLADLYTRTDTVWWTSRNVRCAGHPAVGTRAGSLTYTGCRDSVDNTLHVTITAPGQPSAVFDGSLGGALQGGVGVAVASDDSAATFFVQGTNGVVYRTTVAGNGTATGFSSIGGTAVSGVRASAAP